MAQSRSRSASPRKIGSAGDPTKAGLMELLQKDSPAGWPSKEFATQVFEGSSKVEAFSNFPDFSRNNIGCHTARRCNTFSTPTRLGKREPKPPHKSCDLTSWLCEQCLHKEVTGLGVQILEAVRGEFLEAMGALIKQVSGTLETKMQAVLIKTDRIQTELETPVKVDLRPVLHELNCHKDFTERLETRIASHITRVVDEINSVRNQQKYYEKEMRCQLMELQTEVSKNIEKSHAVHESMLTQLSQSVNAIQQENRHVITDAFPRLESQLTNHFEKKTVNVDFSQVLRQLANAQESANVDFHRVLSEMHKLEDMVGGNVIQVLDQQFRTMEAKLNEIKETEEAQMELYRIKTEFKTADDGVQTDPPPTNEIWTQTDYKLRKHHHHNRIQNGRGKWENGSSEIEREGTTALAKKAGAGFADVESMKAKVRSALIKPQYNVQDFYHTKGIAQKLARSGNFENMTFAMIFINAIWIAVDTDNNDSAMLIDAHPVFQVAENVFCFYFTSELIIRFLAFRRKRNCFKDAWFVFDTLLVSLMVVETWVLTVIMMALGSSGSAGVGDASVLRMVRMVKMIRLSRMARLLRAIPELVILLKAVGAAARIIMVFILLWAFLIYVFAVLFRQASDGQAIGEQYFESVPNAMNTLLLDGILPDNAVLVNRVGGASPGLYPIMMIFILISAVTLMYMLIGVLVNVMGNVASAETEAITVHYVASLLRRAFNDLSFPLDRNLSREDFEQLLVEPAIIRVFQSSGIDAVVLVTMSGTIFEDAQQAGGMNFEYVTELALEMRGSNPSTVKHIKQQLKAVEHLVKDSATDSREQILAHLSAEFKKVNAAIVALDASSDDSGSRRFSEIPSDRLAIADKEEEAEPLS